MLKNLVWGLVVGTALVASVGCGGSSGDDDDSNGGTSGTGNSGNSEAIAKCNAFENVYCTGVVDCLVDSGEIDTTARQANIDACVDAAAKSLDCNRTADVTSNYDACMAALSNPDCAAVSAALDSDDKSGLVPEVCHGVILIYP